MSRNNITEVMTLLRVQENKLGGISQRFSERGKELFEKCVRAQQEKDAYKAAMYAEEIAQLRKMNKVAQKSQLSLNQVILRLETIQEFRDVGAVLGPIVGMVNQIRGDLVGVVPEVANGLAHVDDILDTLIVESGTAGGTMFDTSVSSDEARKILQEASEISAIRTKGKFPESPVGEERAEETSTQ